VLDIAEFELDPGEQVALAGRSGSGKTTLLNAIAGILTPDRGSIRIDGTDVTRLSESRRDALRALTLGYVFQTFNLLQGYTALENVVLGMAFGPGPDRDYARHLLERLELGDRLDHRPRQLSVGQQQRVALARALANRPRLVLADEPTGNLDPVRAQSALALLRDLCAEQGAALLLVSHDRAVLEAFDRLVDLSEINRAAAAPGVTA
jgi:putative ABC transport system ATP-binding protein